MPRQRRIIPPIEQSFDEAMEIIGKFDPNDNDDLYQAVKQKQEEQKHDGEDDSRGATEGL